MAGARPSVWCGLQVRACGNVRVQLCAMGRRRAWVTLLTTDSYLRGVQCLARALRLTDTCFSLVVLAARLSPESLDALRREGCEIRLTPLFTLAAHQRRPAYACAHFADCWTKLGLWAMHDFEQVAYLDADMLPLVCMDELLHTDVPHGVPLLAVPECACRQPSLREHCVYAPPAGSSCRRRWYFNAGLMVLRPDASVHDELLSTLESTDVSAMGFAEQDFLNVVFAARWGALASRYNATKALWLRHRACGAFDEFHANVHFTMAKPWCLKDRGNRGFERLNQLWWDVFLRGAGAKRGVHGLRAVCAVLAIRARGSTASSAQPATMWASDSSAESDADDPGDVPPSAPWEEGEVMRDFLLDEHDIPPLLLREDFPSAPFRWSAER